MSPRGAGYSMHVEAEGSVRIESCLCLKKRGVLIYGRGGR
jgi:hypothetical protein